MKTTCILKGNRVQFTVFRSTDATCVIRDGLMFAEINSISASENSIMNMPPLQPQNYGKMKRRIKTLHSKVVTMYSLYFVK